MTQKQNRRHGAGHGKVEFVEDREEMKRKVIEARFFLKQMGITPESPGFLIKVAKCIAQHWNRANMMELKKYMKFG